MADGFRSTVDFIRVAKAGKDDTLNRAPLVAASSVYTLNKNKVVRIVVGVADRYILLGSDRAEINAATVDATNGILLKANTTVIVSSVDFSFMKESGALEQVIVLEDRG